MADQSHVRQSSQLTAIHKVANRPHRTADRTYIAGRRDLRILVASGLAISTWALFPSTQSGIYVPLPEASTPFVAGVNSAGENVLGDPVNSHRLINAELVSSKPMMYGLATVRYTSPTVTVSLVPLRAKLQALLMLLYSQSGVVDQAALEEKLKALLKLPDSVLAQLIEHPDLADLKKTLDAVFLGTSDISGVKTELDKIDVTSVPGPSEQIDVIKVNGKPAYVVRSPAVQKGTDDASGSAVSLPAPSEPLTVTTLSQVEAPAGLMASAFALAPSSEPLTSAPAADGQIASAFTLAPSSEPLTSAPAPASQIASTFTVAPSSEPLSSTPSASPTPSASVEPTGTSQTSQDIMTSGNKFEPGETATQPSGGDSSATQTATPTTSPTGQQSPADAGGVTSDGGTTSASNNEGSGTP